ncbi:Zinc/iron permease [Tribonema minus]|uniref:Zinc/iron permease n=1 Tax=Tribonema minus TaxID=303371 RepID=A0A835ZDA5_9STRA|nr:Zinc/iron permease [Tribonema minus]
MAKEHWDEGQAWRHALAATAAISILPTLVLPFIPASASKPGSGPLKIMLAFAVGGMLGDVFLHLLPHLMAAHAHGIHEHDHEIHDHDHGHDHAHEHGHSDGGHAHGHHHHDDAHAAEGFGAQSVARFFSLADGSVGVEVDSAQVMELLTGELSVGMTVLGGFLFFFLAERLIRAATGSRDGHSHGHDHAARHKKDDDLSDGQVCEEQNGGLKIGGLLNLAADFMHNVTDGLAIGAAFSTGHALGFATTLSTLLHELPHEIGDFAVLVQSGMRPWKAIAAQFCTAFGALAGTLLGLKSAEWAGSAAASALLGFTAGGFIYVSCVAVMPEVLSSRSGLAQTAGEALALAAGVGLMVTVAATESHHHAH